MMNKILLSFVTMLNLSFSRNLISTLKWLLTFLMAYANAPAIIS